jgi:SAM-dependent methyltransferase
MLGNIAYNEELVFSQFQSLVDLEGASVLEVGGCLPDRLIESVGVKRWVSVDPLAIAASNGKIIRINGEVEAVELPPESVDFVFSCNAFEHIHKLACAMAKIKTILRRDGVLYSHFGPIWSGADGHHLEVRLGETQYNFWEPPFLPHWCHLAYTRVELEAILANKCGLGRADEIAEWIFSNEWTNKLYYEDYIRIFYESGLQLLDLQTSQAIDYAHYIQESSPIGDILSRARHGVGLHRNLSVREICVVMRKV